MALPQPLHIFRKDLVHLWPETLFVIVLFVAFAFAAPSGWVGNQFAVYIALLAVLLRILMVISWLVFVARLIQDESLVGDRQFWTSRPYHWGKLLAAKALAIVTCIYIPFLIMQCYLLKHAGLHPLLVIPALLHNLLLLTVVVIIPFAALASVTSTFPRLLLTFIGAVIALAIILGVVGYALFLHMQVPHLDWLVDTIFIGLPAFALFYQYKTRKTGITRAILIATPILSVLILLVVPTGALIASSYPVLTGSSAPTLASLDQSIHPPAATGDPDTFRGFVSLSLPVSITGLDKESNFLVQGSRVTVTAPGLSYTSPFLTPLGGNQISGGRPGALLNFGLPVDIFNKIHLQPVDLHIEFASEHLQLQNPSTWHATLLPFSIPGNGICSFPTGDNPMGVTNPTCRFPLAQPEVIFVGASLAASSCSTPAAPPAEGEGNLGGGGASLDFDPVVSAPLLFQTGDPNPQHEYVLCAGTPLNFTEATKLPNARLTVDAKQIVLDPFAGRVSPRRNRFNRGNGAPRPQTPPAEDPQP